MSANPEDIKNGVKAYIETIRAVGECVRDLGQVPAGVLYAQLMGRISLERFEAIINLLVSAKVVRRDNHLLTYIGAAKPPAAENALQAQPLPLEI